MSNSQRPAIKEIKLGNGKIMRFHAEKFMLDLVRAMVDEDLNVGDLVDSLGLHKDLQRAIVDLARFCDPHDPAWGDVFSLAEAEDLSGFGAPDGPIASVLNDFVTDFLKNLFTAGRPDQTLVERNYKYAIDKRLLKDFVLGKELLKEFGALDEASFMARQELADRSSLATLNDPPPPQPYGVSHFGAEHLVCDWMKHLGFEDAEVTKESGDGGIDVVTSGSVVQVKNYKDSVGVQALRELLGVAVSERKLPVLFTSGTLTLEASNFVDKNAIPVFRYSAEGGTLESLNQYADEFMELGREFTGADLMDVVEESRIPMALAGQLVWHFMSAMYALKGILNYWNEHMEDFDADNEAADLSRADVQATQTRLMLKQDQLIESIEIYGQNLDSEDTLLRLAEQIRELNVEFFLEFRHLIASMKDMLSSVSVNIER